MKINKLGSFLLLALTILVGCKQEQGEKTETPSEEVITEEVEVMGKEVAYQTDSTTMRGYIAWNANAGEKRPGILVIHEWWGHNDYTRQRADMLAELGYVAFAVDMYGDGQQAEHPDEAGKFAGMVMQNMDEARARFNAALEVLKNNENVDPEKIAAIGYCFGGSVALTMANTGADLDAVAAFHSGINLPVGPSADLKAKVLVCNGAKDPMIAAEDVAAFTGAMDSVGADYKYVSYENAMHSFTSKAADSLGQKFQMPMAYDAEAAEKSWQELQALLKEVF
ncbi:dienelactone hydrolase family protein [Robertkochia marina]|uniref:Dienelactone hydrolase family protein n=1 Tax=Robertkochia marina TaxID=1227945 RepID=A0A4V3UY62_9FLAO|nr:dienelactone hydrolase family protein [Robertkochia marina]THD67896.1 dienelactone hydrolase family protein [Robertkochia marina]TRZ41003.1 dienelactone hydrolase family protein [Robertkochia marina]